MQQYTTTATVVLKFNSAEAKILNIMENSLFALCERGVVALNFSTPRTGCPDTWDLLLNGNHTQGSLQPMSTHSEGQFLPQQTWTISEAAQHGMAAGHGTEDSFVIS